MKAITVYGPNDMRLENVEMRPLGDDEVLIKVIWAGVCATDIAIYTGECSFVKSGEITYPCRIGHEWAGIVEKVGKDVKDFKKGDRVITDNAVSCNECDNCRDGNYAACTNSKSVGTINCWDGCFSEYMYMPERHTYHLADNVTFKNAAIIEPMSIALSSIKKYDITKDTTVAVIGTGSIGICACALAKYMGAGKVVIIGRNQQKMDIALKCGADFTVCINDGKRYDRINEITDGQGIDFTIETSGAGTCLNEALHVTKKYGVVSSLAFYEKPIDGFEIDTLVSKRIQLKGAMGEFGYVPEAADILAASNIDLTPMITDHIDLEQMPEFFADTVKPGSYRIKVLVKVNEE